MDSDIHGSHRGQEKGREDNFGNLVANPLTDLLDVAGEKDFASERLRAYRNGSRVFLQYGTDSGFEETPAGQLLKPAGGETLTKQSAQRISYPVGFDVIASLAFGLNKAPAAGDVVAGGYGNPDLANYDPLSRSYSGSSADGYFWYLDEQTGLDSVFLAGVRDGTIFDSRTANRKAAWSIIAQWLNWYDVGPSRFYQRYTDIKRFKTDPQRNDFRGAVANDTGKASLIGSHRVTFSIHQASGNSGLELEAGSIGVSVPGRFSYIFKPKRFKMTFDVTDGTSGTFEAVGAIRLDPDRAINRLKIVNTDVVRTPSSSTNARCLLFAIDPSSTNLSDGQFSTPEELSENNSIVESVSDNAATMPDAGDANTDSTGAETAETVSNPGGYQVGYHGSYAQGTGSVTERNSVSRRGEREVYDTDYAIIAIASDETGSHEVDFITEENT
jgi:hypothetical protein